MPRVTLKRMFISVAVMALACLPATAQQRIDWAKVQIKTTDLGNGVYLLGWQGGDSLLLVNDAGVVLVDTSVAENGANIMTAIRKLTDKPVSYVIITHAHADHFGANELFVQQGRGDPGARQRAHAHGEGPAHRDIQPDHSAVAAGGAAAHHLSGRHDASRGR